MRDCAMMKAIKFVYSDLLVTLRMGCAKCTETYFQAVERELVKRTRQPTFMEANSELAVVPHVVSAINGWALESCKYGSLKCAANKCSIREQTSKFPGDVIDGLCLDCFDKKDRCSKHWYETSNEKRKDDCFQRYNQGQQTDEKWGHHRGSTLVRLDLRPNTINNLRCLPRG